MIESRPLDICGQDLYSGWSLDYGMDSQQNLFRYLDQPEHSSSDSSVSPLVSKAKKTEILCDYCNKPILRYFSEIKIHKHHFCSILCHNKWQRQNYKFVNKETLKNRSKRWFNNSLKKYNYIHISNEQEQILMGSLLGDGCLRKYVLTQYRETHSLKQKDYLIWKKNILALPHSPFSEDKICRYETLSLLQLNKYYYMFYQNGKKVVTKEILDKLEPLGLAVWYMDDGCLTKNSIILCTDTFSYDENLLIQNYFKDKLGIQTKISKINYPNNPKDYFRIRFCKKAMIKFLQVIKLYIVECMNYKLIKVI